MTGFMKAAVGLQFPDYASWQQGSGRQSAGTRQLAGKQEQ